MRKQVTSARNANKSAMSTVHLVAGCVEDVVAEGGVGSTDGVVEAELLVVGARGGERGEETGEGVEDTVDGGGANGCGMESSFGSVFSSFGAIAGSFLGVVEGAVDVGGWVGVGSVVTTGVERWLIRGEVGDSGR